jgi:hypothetical protein
MATSPDSRYTMRAGIMRHIFGIGKPVHPSAPWEEQVRQLLYTALPGISDSYKPWAYLRA